ncbi:MAG TPA: hypothetical protein V6C81_31395 [Planktothrix sp.]|jgi:hypothetical protein
MGSRATYAVRTEDGTQLYYSHWGGQHVEDDLLWGSEVAIPFIRSLDRGSADDLLLDTAWCEGGAVVDAVKRTLLVFGGESISSEPDLRNMWLRLARVAWDGWKVNWAYHGMADIADALDVPRERVLGKLSYEKFDPNKLYSCHTAGRARMLLSIKESDGTLKHIGFDAPLEYYVFGGTKLIEVLDRCKPYSVAELKLGQDLPQDAIFIDVAGRALVVTLAAVFGNYDPRYQGLIEEAWSGWTVKLNFEGLSEHTKVAQLDFQIPSPSTEKMLQSLRRSACEPWAYDNASTVQPDFIEKTPANSFHNHKVVLLPETDRAARFDKLVSQLKAARE